MDLMLEDNPWGMYNPRGHYKRHKRGARKGLLGGLGGIGGGAAVRTLTGGLTLVEVASAVGGFAAVQVIPALVVKDTTKITGKLLKVAVALGTTLAAGMVIGKAVGGGSGKAALIGGMTSTGVQIVNVIRPGTIASSGGMKMLPRGIGDAALVSPAFTREGETVSLIQP
mgnify:CR=1 FL=1